MDDKEYQSALTLCLNYIPNQEGSLSPRSGFKRIGITKDGAPAKLLPFRFNYFEPYVSEFTFENLRFWANGLPILRAAFGVFVSVAGDPPTFTITSSISGDTAVPTTWPDGASIMVALSSVAGMVIAGHLVNREFILNIVSRSLGTFTLTDALTGSPLTGSLAGITGLLFYSILDHDTPYEFVNNIRQVQFTSQSLVNSINTAVDVITGPEHRVSYLSAVIVPRSISHVKGLEYGLIKEQFIDGPYMDSLGSYPATVSAVDGTITLTLFGWSALTRYMKGDLIYYAATGFWYLSLQDTNIANTPPADISSWWVFISDPTFDPEDSWSAVTSYALGVPLYYRPLDADGLGVIYYSIQAANLNNPPQTSPLWWSTTPPTWDIAATYPAHAVVIDGGIRYISVSVPVVGTAPAAAPLVWFVITSTFLSDAVTALDGPTGFNNKAQFFPITDAGDVPVNGQGRLMRLKASPQPWANDWSYTAGDFVNYKDNIYIALTSANLNNIPDQDAVAWELQSKTILWTWGQIVTVVDEFTVTLLIKGDPLPNTNPIWEWRMGLYSDTTGWPRCGTFHEGRLAFCGPIQNRIDFGRSNLGYDFTPTAPDGTVADNNAMAYVLNSAEDERIHALRSTAEGVVACSSEKEWLVSASNLNDPLTPTSIQAHPITAFGTTDAEICGLPSGLAFIQSGRRRLMEFRSFVDTSNYQSRLNALDLTRRCQHLTGDGIIEAQYQRLPQPVIWCLPGGVIQNLSTPDICPPSGTIIVEETVEPYLSLFGLAYARTPDVQYVAPFSYEHGLVYSGSTTTRTNSIAVQRGALDTAEYLYHAVTIAEDGECRMEMLMPVMDPYPFDDLYNANDTVKNYGTLSSAFMVDSGIQPCGAKVAVDGLSITFYGLYQHAGKTVSFTCRGKYVGDYLITATGTATVLFNDAFTKALDVGRAMQATGNNATLLPYVFQTFYLDKNGNTMLGETGCNVFFGQFGYAYKRRGQQLRPAVPGRNGPAFAKVRRNEEMGVYVERAQEISIGDTFNTLFALPLEVPRTDGKESSTPVTINDFVTGIFKNAVADDHTYNGTLCWEQTRPVPGAVLAVGGFEELTD